MKTKKVVDSEVFYALKRIDGDKVFWLYYPDFYTWTSYRKDRNDYVSRKDALEIKRFLKNSFDLTKEQMATIKIVKITRTYKA